MSEHLGGVADVYDAMGERRPAMTESKDVLAVLDSAAAEVDCQCGHPRCSKQRERAEILKARAAVAELIEALRLGEAVESMFVAMTAEGRIDCRELWAAELCEAFQRFQDARIPALAACTPAKSEGR